jgi:ABC-2 type transport system permease protein
VILNLVRAEVIRLVSRRFTQLMVVVLLGAFGVTLATTLSTTSRPTERELVFAEQRAESERAQLRSIQAECEQAQRSEGPSELRLRYRQVDCDSFDPARVDEADFLSGIFSFTGHMRDLLMFLSGFLALFGFLVGASFVGADMTSGGMTNLLLWRPERVRVLAAKLGTLLAGVAALAVAATLLYLGTFWVVAEVAGLPGNQTGAFWGELALVSLRGIALALVAAALAFCVATAGRHTSAAVGLLVGYAVVWEIGARLVMEISGTADPGRWMFSSYLAAWMNGRVDQWDATGQYTVHWWQAGLLLGVLLGVVVGGVFAHFRRRDLA